MDKKEIDATIMEAKRFLNQHRPPRQDKVGDFLSFTKRKFSALATYFLEDKGLDLGAGGGKTRNVDWPPDIQIR